MGEYAEAESSLKSSLEMRIAALGPNSQFAANTYKQLAYLYLKQGLRDSAVVQLHAAMVVGIKLGWGKGLSSDGMPKVRIRGQLHNHARNTPAKLHSFTAPSLTTHVSMPCTPLHPTD